MGRVKAQPYKAYEKRFKEWMLTHPIELKRAIGECFGTFPLSIEIDFHFKNSQLYCKDGKIKRLDVSNRLKCFLDLLSQALQFDDSRFFQVKCKKSVAEQEEVNVNIQKWEIP